MNIICRLLARSDGAELSNAVEGVFDYTLDPALTDEFLSDDRHHLAGAFDGDRLVGMASAVHYVHPDKAAQMFINEVGVSNDYRGQGIAGRLLELLLDRGCQLGCTEAWVLTDPDNAPANALYRGAGGEPSNPQVMYTFKFSDPSTRSA